MKRKFVKVMFFGALALSTVTYVGCKDYDDDIDNLQTQIDAVKVSLEELQTKVNSGSVITNVVKGENGITVTLSDGKSYELTNGKMVRMLMFGRLVRKMAIGTKWCENRI